MYMAMGMGVAVLIVNIMCFVFFIMVLVKLFKNEGALKGILGFFCSIYTFVWGWMKHKQLGMTKLMVTWSILTVAGMVMVPVLGVSSVLMIPQYLQQMSGDSKVKLSKIQSSKTNHKINWAEKRNQASAAAKPSQNQSQHRQNDQNEDWGKKSLALWQGGHYKDPKRAINYWTRAIQSDQNAAIAYSNRGLAYHGLQQYHKAVDDYSQAIKIDPGYAAAYNNRGSSYYELNKYELALNDFNQSLKLNPQYAKAYLNRGLAFYQINENTQACSDFQKSCDQGDCDGRNWAKKNGICN